MNEERVVLAFAAIALVMAVVAMSVTYFSVANLVTKISGYSTGTANLTVESAAAVNFTTNIVNWGSGIVDSGQTSSYLDTKAGTVVNGNWTANSAGLVLENIGNVNVTLNLSVGKTAATFIGGTNPAYLWNISSDEPDSCLDATGGSGSPAPGLGIYFNPNTTTALWCNVFQFADNADTVRIHFNLTIPADSLTGDLGDIVTATAVAV